MPLKTKHKQQLVRHGDIEGEVDVKIAPLVLELWKAGLSTNRSCQDHGEARKVWIAFDLVEHAERFLNIVADRTVSPDLWRRANAWGFGMFGRRSETIPSVPGPVIQGPEAWEYHVDVTDGSFDNVDGIAAADEPAFMFGLSVLFPKPDLQEVLANIRAFNVREGAD